MYKIKVNEDNDFEATIDKDSNIHLNDQLIDWDVIKINDHFFHIILNNKSYKAELVKVDYEQKAFTIKINGQQLVADAKDRFDLLLDKLGMSNLNANAVNDLKAPMPGLILDILVSEGMAVQKGDPLIILEAMKMENLIKSPGEGEVKSIKVKKGDGVEKNQLLIEF